METKRKGLVNRLDKFGNTLSYAFFRGSGTVLADLVVARPTLNIM